MIDATTLTEIGFAGKDVDHIAAALVEAAGHDLELAERGIVYIDEIDKIAAVPHAGRGRSDIGGSGVQRGLLGLIEGRSLRLDAQGLRPYSDDLLVDTREVLFICGGAFAGLERIVERRGGHAGAVEAGDLVAYGLLPELVGRLPIMLALDVLHERDLVRILTEPRNSLVAQYQALFAMSDAELELDRGALEEIAARAAAQALGARGLRSVLETILLDDMFELPHAPAGRRIMLDRAIVAARLGTGVPPGAAAP
jgi:ATP-dependent Clp protease ATP-binding subunit ClpX